jgi:hypothetical protein
VNYNPKLVFALWREMKLPAAVAEHPFCDGRKWRFDFAFPAQRVAVEVQGGVFMGGRHTRGAALLKEYEKWRAAAMLGWRILPCIPQEVCTTRFARELQAALEFKPSQH